MEVAVVEAADVAVDPLSKALKEACVENWLRRLRPVTRPTYESNLKHWLLWLWKHPGWEGKRPSELLDFQENARKGREAKLLLGLMKDFVQEKGGTYSSMQVRLSHLRSFFFLNDVEIPEALNWSPEPTREPVQGKLTFDQVREIVSHAKPRDQAVFLTMLQGVMDKERFHVFNTKYAQPLITRLKTGDLDTPFRVDFLLGRKRNKRPFFTYLYHDALAAWKLYFDRIRGSWPKEGQPIALETYDRPLSKDAPANVFDTIARQLGYKPPVGAGNGDKGFRTGVAVHDAFRDVVKSRLQTAKKKGFDMTCVDFWMGHKIDPYNYNRFTENEPEYVLENAKIAAQYLNIVSGPVDDQQLKAMAKENEELRSQMAKVTQDMAQLRGEFEKAFEKRLTD